MGKVPPFYAIFVGNYIVGWVRRTTNLDVKQTIKFCVVTQH
jgi:hypothetical protein